MRPDLPAVTVDFETRSYADLQQVGAWAYSEHRTTDVICVCWGVGDEPVRAWWPDHFGLPGADDPEDLLALVRAGHPVEAHNVAFELSMWHNVLGPRYGWPVPRLRQWRDTMAVACYYALPAALDHLLRALGMPGKDPNGTRLISKYSKLHLKTATEDIPPEKLAEWVVYCRDDVRAEQDASDYLGDLPPVELENFLLDLEMNFRGLHLDEAAILRAQQVVEARKREVTERFEELTGLKPGQRDKVLAWFRERGTKLENMQAEYLTGLLERPETDEAPADEDAPEPVRLTAETEEALRLKLRINKSSTTKLDAMLRQRGSDGRARFQTRYHGAQTGRNTGGGVQPLNLVRSWEDVEPDELVRDIMHGEARLLDVLYGDAMDAIGHAMRHFITAEPGNEFTAGDLKSIEAVLNACLSGEEWKIDLFRRGGDPYVAFASQALGREVLPKDHPDVTVRDKLDRQRVGKPGELAFGYQGGYGAWLKFDNSGRFERHEIESFKDSWRDNHPAVSQHWRDMEWAAKDALTHPGSEQWVSDHTMFQTVDEFLTMRLASGKRIWYYRPELRMLYPAWHRPREDETCREGTCGHERRPALTYLTVQNKMARRVSTYGGKLVENEVQATSREVLMPRVRELCAAGYDPVLTVYDEVLCEVAEGFGSGEEFKRIMERLEPWARAWPIRCDEPWRGLRYRKG